MGSSTCFRKLSESYWRILFILVQESFPSRSIARISILRNQCRPSDRDCLFHEFAKFYTLSLEKSHRGGLNFGVLALIKFPFPCPLWKWKFSEIDLLTTGASCKLENRRARFPRRCQSQNKSWFSPDQSDGPELNVEIRWQTGMFLQSPYSDQITLKFSHGIMAILDG